MSDFLCLPWHLETEAEWPTKGKLVELQRGNCGWHTLHCLMALGTERAEVIKSCTYFDFMGHYF